MRICIYGDVHWSTTSSIIRSRGKQYSTRLENLIKSVNWSEELAEKYSCDAIVCLGDFFDKPVLNAEELSALLEVKWTKNKPHYFLVGNHEITLSTLEYNSTNALKSEDFIIIDKPQRLTSYKTDILFIPYIIEENIKDIKDYWKDTEMSNMMYTQEVKNSIIFSHNDLKNIQYGAWTSTNGFDIKEIENNCDLYINGHLHNGMFVNEKETILNLGILSGQDFKEDATKYSHLACILDTETLQMDFYENPHAFNFYKLEINKESDIDKLFKLKNNAVLTIKCEESLLQKVRDTINTLSNVVEQRIISYKNMGVHEDDVTSTEKIELNAVDHLKQFYTFIMDNVDSTVVSRDILKEELSKVVM